MFLERLITSVRNKVNHPKEEENHGIFLSKGNANIFIWEIIFKHMGVYHVYDILRIIGPTFSIL